MRTIKKFMTAGAFMALAALVLTGCATPSAQADDTTSSIACLDIQTNLDAANENLKTAKADLKEGEGTPAEADAKVAIADAEATIKALNTRATECEADGGELMTKEERAELTDELKAILDVAHAPLTDITCSVIVEKTGGTVVDDTYALLLETLKGVEKGNASLRQWSDALSIPLKGKDAAEKRLYVQRAICEEPIIGVSLAHLFAHLKVEGIPVLDLQSTAWLEPYAVQSGEINDLVASFMPVTQWKLENISKKDIPEDVYLEGLTANHKYQELASRLNLLLSKYQLGQVMSINSTHHYTLKAGGLTADSVPEVKISNEVDDKPALVFYLTKKTDDCKPVSVLAFNTGDKRPMLGNVVDSCEELTTPPSPPGTPGNPGTPGTPETPCPPGMTGTPPVCKDSSTNDPYAQGNAPDGGGQNNDPGPGAPTDTGGNRPPETPRENPAPPVQQPPTSTPDPTPAPEPEPQAPPVTAPETGCKPKPGVNC